MASTTIVAISGRLRNNVAGACVVEKAIYRSECLARAAHWGEVAIRWETAGEPPGQEDRLADGMIVRQSTMERDQEEEVRFRRRDSRLIHSQVNNLRHVEPPSEEDRLADGMIVRQASMECDHEEEVLFR